MREGGSGGGGVRKSHRDNARVPHASKAGGVNACASSWEEEGKKRQEDVKPCSIFFSFFLFRVVDWIFIGKQIDALFSRGDALFVSTLVATGLAALQDV